MSERRRSLEDSNLGLMWEQLNSTAFLAHPYQWPIIGWRSDIENWRQGDVEAFHRNWYAVNNAVMVICGAFDRDEMLAKLEAKIGSIPGREIPRGVVTVEPEQRGERRVVLRKEANLGAVMMAWHVPETAHEDLRVLELVELLLGRGESSRLYRRLVDADQLALWAFASTDEHFDPGLFEIVVQAREGVDGPSIEAAVYDELRRLREEGVGERELQKAKNMLVTAFYRGMSTINGRANQLGTFELFHGDWRSLFDVVGTYESIRSADIQRVIETYLVDDNRTVVTLVPATRNDEEAHDDAR